jgi:hypothetical protein
MGGTKCITTSLCSTLGGGRLYPSVVPDGPITLQDALLPQPHDHLLQLRMVGLYSLVVYLQSV